MINKDALNHLTDGYKSIAQMSIQLAHELGYMTNYNSILVAPRGDDTSAGLPFIIDAIPNENGQFEFSSYDMQFLHTVSPEYQVLVYGLPEPSKLSDKQQYKLLCQFANRFGHESLIGRFLTPALLHWIAENSDYPDIHFELQRMRNVANRLDGHLDDLEELI